MEENPYASSAAVVASESGRTKLEIVCLVVSWLGWVEVSASEES